ncbi:MAG: hypothetical protein Q8N16_03005 [bacterium]|nr:hypothetical protein [bacterium]
MPNNKFSRGVSLYLTVMILALVLSVALGSSILLTSQIKSLRNIGNSVAAFYAAETGIERSLYALVNGSTQTRWEEQLNGASYGVDYLSPGLDCPGLNYCLKSIGAYKDVKRGIRIVR